MMLVPATMEPPITRDPAVLLSAGARETLQVLARRWSIPILEALQAGVLRHGQLRAAVEGIADKVLVETLRVLEAHGLVDRTVYAEVPLRVEYGLTEPARRLAGALSAFDDWALELSAGAQDPPPS